MKTLLKIVTSSYVTPFNILAITGIAMATLGANIAGPAGIIVRSIGATLCVVLLAKMVYALYEG